ncbi:MULTISPECIES: DUF6366 family protein [Bacillaceae]|uniref:DUF6366 family protein n=1 Tax=Bacillus sp. 7894-2 TaxID=2021695 RepID=UPI000BA5C75D|nr:MULTISPECIES: DUF6366 family protein [Bacillaceae]PAE23941.1 hypothetical protein CHI10_15335 [Bacillus sp. 7894-2]URM34838.1 DUF6366 family protein [Cytobacillus firmus]
MRKTARNKRYKRLNTEYIHNRNSLQGVFNINKRDETPEEKRERLKQSELNTTSALNDSLNRGSKANLTFGPIAINFNVITLNSEEWLYASCN